MLKALGPRVPKGTFLFLLAALCSALPQMATAADPPLRDAFADTNGVRLHYRIGGQGPPVILLHGLAQSGMFWHTLVPALSSNYTVIVPDLRGHGASNNPSGIYRHADVATDIFGLLDQLKIEKVSAVGHSSGASVLLHMATRQPARVEKMVVIGLAHRVTDEMFNGRSRFPYFADWPPIWKRGMKEQQPQRTEQQINATVDYIRSMDRADITISTEQLARIQATTLIAFGDRDSHPVEIVVELYRSILHAQLWIVPNQGHTPFWPEWGGSELAAEEFPKVLAAFLASPNPARP